ncbi:MAG TPA: hypothetical protein VD995_18975 [Azospirillum sp.]|nr:hypothetical protein [Azospirillum sp.]
MTKAYRAAGVALLFTHALDAHAEPSSLGSGYLAMQRWLHAADVAANESVTYEICGWGMIDLRTPFLSSAIKQGVDVTAWDELARRYDDAARERQRTEALLTAHGANAPMQRTSGLHATGGCTDAVRERIERQTTHNAP